MTIIKIISIKTINEHKIQKLVVLDKFHSEIASFKYLTINGNLTNKLTQQQDVMNPTQEKLTQNHKLSDVISAQHAAVN